MKNLLKVLAVMIVLIAIVSLAACGSETPKSNSGDITGKTEETTAKGTQDSTPTGHTHSYGAGVVTTAATYSSSGVMTYSCECGVTKTETIPSLIPTSADVASGIKQMKNATSENYDFGLKLSGAVSVFGMNVNANAVYNGKYRYNDGELRFMRETDGNIMFKTCEYIYTEGSSRIKVSMNNDGSVKKLSVNTGTSEELTMINLPFVKIVEALSESNITNVKADTSKSGYKFSANMQFASDFAPLNELFSSLGNIGARISIKSVKFNNPQGGVKLYFNITDDGKLSGFAYSIDVNFPVSSKNVTITLDYSQKDSTAVINLPSVKAYVSDGSAKQNALNTINSAINAVKNSSSYSIDMTAKNDLDAGWNKLAVVDKYISRLYKNTNDGRVDFNHSYEYKAHTDEDGKETFKYTVGNIQDGTVYKISRKGANQQQQMSGVGVNDRFDIHFSGLNFNASDIDFIMTVNNKDGSVTYKLFLKESAGLSVQKKICDLINSNDAAGVTKVENYLNNKEYKIEECDCSFTIKSGKLVSASVNTEIKYVPTAGEYKESVVTLKNSIEISVDKNIKNASKYEAPKNVETKLSSLGLNNAKYYIL